MSNLLKTLKGLKDFCASKKLEKIRKFPSQQQWKRFFVVLTKKEKLIFFILLFFAVISYFALNLNFYLKHTKIVAASGGIYKEGVVGQPRFINPIYLSTQDVDRDIVEILFSGLMKYNENGNLVEDLAQNYEIKEDGKVFEFSLKNNIFWHDKKPITADDVIFTVNLIQNPDYASPLRIEWSGIVAEKISDNKVCFKIPKKYAVFLETLTLKILPKHIFESVSPKNLPTVLLSQNYLIGSGPFKFKELIKNKSGFVKKIILERNENYYGTKPFFKKFSFVFYETEKDLLKGADLDEIDGFALVNPKYFENKTSAIIKKGNLKFYSLSMPRYFALFFNSKNTGIIQEKKLREALALAIDKQEIIKNIFSEKATMVDSPILPNFFNFEPPVAVYNFNPAKTSEILDELGFRVNAETGKREKVKIQEPQFVFKANLKTGAKGEEVKELQKCLARSKDIYPEGEISGIFGEKTKMAVIRLQEKYTQEILEPSSLTKGTGEVKSATRKKLNEICFDKNKEIIPLEVTLNTYDKFPLLEIAEVLKNNWEATGIMVKIQKVSSLADLQADFLAKRSFDIFLFGEALGSIPDPFPFWHSSQKDYPGLNIAGYCSKEADKLLEEARETHDYKERKKTLEKFQNILINDLPAVFLIRPDYVYALSVKVKGQNIKQIIEPAKRFSTIEKLFVKTIRVWN